MSVFVSVFPSFRRYVDRASYIRMTGRAPAGLSFDTQNSSDRQHAGAVSTTNHFTRLVVHPSREGKRSFPCDQ
jgi:hypothetical protein